MEGLVAAAQQALQAKQPQPLENFGRGKRQHKQLGAATAPQQLVPSSKGPKGQLHAHAEDWQPGPRGEQLHAPAGPEAAASSRERTWQAHADDELPSSKRQKQLPSPIQDHADAGTRHELGCLRQASRSKPAVLRQAPTPCCQERPADPVQHHEVLAGAAVSRQGRGCQDAADADVGVSSLSPSSSKADHGGPQEMLTVSAASVSGQDCASKKTCMLPPASVQQRAGPSSCIVAAADGTAAAQLPPESMQRPAQAPVLPAVADQPCGQPLLIPIRQAHVHAPQGPLAALFEPSPSRPRCAGLSCSIPLQHAACLPLLSERQRRDQLTSRRYQQGREVPLMGTGFVKTLQPANCEGMLLAAALRSTEA